MIKAARRRRSRSTAAGRCEQRPRRPAFASAGPVVNNVITVGSAGFAPWRKCRILNAWVDSLTVEEVVERLDEGILWTLNPDHLYHLQRNPDFLNAYRQASIVSSDSKYVYWGLRFLGRRIQSKASGSDIVPAYWRRHAEQSGGEHFPARCEAGHRRTGAAADQRARRPRDSRGGARSVDELRQRRSESQPRRSA